MRRNSGLGYRSEIVDGPRPFGFCVLRWPRRVGQIAAVKESIEGHLGAGVAPASIAFRGRSVVGEGPANRRPEHLLTGPTTPVPPPRRGPSCLKPGKQAHRVRHQAALGQVCGRPRVTSGGDSNDQRGRLDPDAGSSVRHLLGPPVDRTGASPRFVGGNEALQAVNNFFASLSFRKRTSDAATWASRRLELS